MRWLWHRDGITGSPSIGGGSAYAFDNGDLVQLALTNGHTMNRVHVGDVTRFATPAPVGNYVLAGTTSEVVAIVGGP